MPRFFQKEETKTVFWGWSPTPDDVGQKSLNLTCYDVTHKKNKRKLPNFLIETTRRYASLEGLNSSLAISVKKVMTGQSHTDSL